MGQLLLLLVVALTVAAVVFGVTVLVSGRDPGLVPAEPDGRATPLPGGRPLTESDIGTVRFDTALRGYRMEQVDQALRRAAYDIGYKSELIGVLEAEVAALREGRTAEADELRRTRLAAQAQPAVSGEDVPTTGSAPAGADTPAVAVGPTHPAVDVATPTPTPTPTAATVTSAAGNDAPVTGTGASAAGTGTPAAGGTEVAGETGDGEMGDGEAGRRPSGQPVVRSESA